MHINLYGLLSILIYLSLTPSLIEEGEGLGRRPELVGGRIGSEPWGVVEGVIPSESR